MTIRSVEELTNVAEPAWDDIQGMTRRNPSARVIPGHPKQSQDVLWRLQVTAHSYLGALALRSGGLLADDGWFRILGGGSPQLVDLATANHLGEPQTGAAPPPFLLVGYDALGGRFAIDGGGLDVAAGEVCYFGPDTLTWDGLGGGHADFVRAAIQGQLTDAFEPLRWTGWQEEVRHLRPDQGLSIYPPPFSREATELAS